MEKNELWISRDKSGDLWVYDSKPVWIEDEGYFYSDDCSFAEVLPRQDIFPEVTVESSPMRFSLEKERPKTSRSGVIEETIERLHRALYDRQHVDYKDLMSQCMSAFLWVYFRGFNNSKKDMLDALEYLIKVFKKTWNKWEG